jgi:ankyrin repeat protein
MIQYFRIVLIAAALWVPQAHAGVYDEILAAANQEDTEKVVGLLRRGMDVNTSDPQGNTLLMIAARANNMSLVRFLLDNRANPLKRNRYGDTAMMLAALQGHGDIVQLMLERKVSPNHPGWNPLHYAAFENRDRIIAMLVAGGADINARAPNGWTALMLAAQRGHVETARVLVGSGADIAVADPGKGTAIDLATEARHVDLASFLEQAQGGRVSR